VTVRTALSLALVLAAARLVRAEGPPPVTPATPLPAPIEAHLAKARDFMAAHDFIHTRDELLLAYRIEPRAELLFALGQVEFNLGHYQEAVDYYQRFAAMNPAPDQAALAQQAIGAARIELHRPPPIAPRPAPPLHRELDAVDRTLVVAGGLASVAGAGLFGYGHHLAEDRAGTLHDYDLRIKHAHIAEWSGGAALGAGTLAIAVALLRWRVHLVETTIAVHATDGGVALTLEHAL
jgi:tetratricopeptide (TPR) repeat protein